jgi:hypothetical protein
MESLRFKYIKQFTLVTLVSQTVYAVLVLVDYGATTLSMSILSLMTQYNNRKLVPM